jgi:SlyX protein
MTDDDLIISIETKLAYQEDTIQALNDVVCQQQKQIEELKSTCKILVERMGLLSESIGDSNPEDEIPPHY